MKIRSALVAYTHPAKGEYKKTLDFVEKVLKKNGINYELADRDFLKEIQFSDRDIILAVGGDGTFLRAAQFVKGQLIFGVNADIKNKEGFFMKSDKRDFHKKLEMIQNGRFKVKKLSRLQAKIDGRKIATPALNEFFIGPRKSYHAAKYIIRLGKTKERQKSSGILVTTPAGSYAWAKACNGQQLGLESDKFQFIVREPFEGNVFKDYKLKSGMLEKSQKIAVHSEMLDGILIADSVGKEHAFEVGKLAEIILSENYLKVIWF